MPRGRAVRRRARELGTLRAAIGRRFVRAESPGPQSDLDGPTQSDPSRPDPGPRNSESKCVPPGACGLSS